MSNDDFLDKLLSSKNLSYEELYLLTENLTFEEIVNLSGEKNCSVTAQPILHLAALEIFIAVVGFILNAMAMFVIIALKDYKKSISHWYVLQLAIADSIFLILLILMGHQHLYGLWLFPDWMCNVYQAFFMTNYYAGILFLTVMSFDRYVAIVHPVSAYWRKLRTHRNAVIVTVIVWVCALLLSIPAWKWSAVNCNCGYDFPAESSEVIEHHGIEHDYDYSQEYASIDFFNFGEDPEFGDESGSGSGDTVDLHEGHTNVVSTACYNSPWKSFRIWVMSNFIINFILPVIIMSICYCLILWRVLHPTVTSVHKSTGFRKSSDSQPRPKGSSLAQSFRSSLSSASSSTRHSSKNLSQKHKVTVIVVSLVALFILCWLPFYVVQLLKLNVLHSSKEGCAIITDTVNVLAFLNSLLNPIFYTFLGSKFTHRLRSAFRAVRRSSSSSAFTRYTRHSRTGGPSHGRTAGTVLMHKTNDVSTSCHATTHSMAPKYHSHSQQENSQHLISQNSSDA